MYEGAEVPRVGLAGLTGISPLTLPCTSDTLMLIGQILLNSTSFKSAR